MVKREEGCLGCSEVHGEVLKLEVEDPSRPSNEKEIRSFYNCGLCAMEFKKLRAEGSPEVRNMAPNEYLRVEVGSTPVGFQVWCRRHDVNVIHVDFEGQKMVANMTRAGSPH